MPSAPSTPARPLWLFATLWSLRQYPTLTREWSWTRKFTAIRDAGFAGVMSPPIPAVAERGALRYLAITSASAPETIAPAMQAAKKLDALAICFQLGRPETSTTAALRLVRRIRDVSRELDLPFAIETHRGTFTERPETILALQRAYRQSVGEPLPMCLDYSHPAVVRHLTHEQSWPSLLKQPRLLAHASQLHLRPFNAHHAQLPVLDARGRRTPEYLAWRDQFATPLLHHLGSRRSLAPVLAVPEIGHAAPAYGLSTHGDTWQDVLAVTRDLRAIWAAQAG